VRSARNNPLVLSPETTKLIVEDLSKGIQLYNCFNVGKYEKQILHLRDLLEETSTPEGKLVGEVKIILPSGNETTVPAELFGFLVASSKHLGDMVMRYSRSEKKGR
jgi:hypothetical protein